MLSHNLVLKVHILETNKQKVLSLKEIAEGSGVQHNWKNGYKRKWPVPAESQASPWENCTVNIKKGEIRRKQMASFQNFVNCSHKPSRFFKVVQVLGITLKQLSSEFKGFRVYVMLPKTRSLHLYHKLDPIPKSLTVGGGGKGKINF